MTQIIAAIIAGVFQLIVALIRCPGNGIKKEEKRSVKRSSSRAKCR